MEKDETYDNAIRKDLRRLAIVLTVLAVVMSAMQYLSLKTTIISELSHKLYKATLENS